MGGEPSDKCTEYVTPVYISDSVSILGKGQVVVGGEGLFYDHVMVNDRTNIAVMVIQIFMHVPICKQMEDFRHGQTIIVVDSRASLGHAK